MQPISPFPKEKGQVEVVRRKDLAILLSVSLTAAGLCSLLLNLLVFRQHLWSLYVIGACVLIWVMSIPAVIYTKLPIYLSLLFDGLAVMLYQFLIGFNTTDHSWFFGLSLPITALCTLATILFAFCLRKISSAFLMKALLFFRGSRSAVRRYRAAHPPVPFTSAATDLVGGRMLRLWRYCNLADHDSLPCKAQERSTKAHALLSLFLLFCIIKKNVPWHILAHSAQGVDGCLGNHLPLRRVRIRVERLLSYGNKVSYTIKMNPAKQDSPPAAGRASDILPFRCSAIHAGVYYRMETKFPYDNKKPETFSIISGFFHISV